MGNKNSNICTASEVISDHSAGITCSAVSQDSSLLVTGSDDATVRMWSTATHNTECLGVLRGHNEYITCLGICDTFIVSGSADCTIRKWCMTSCECLYVFTGHTSRVLKIVCLGEFFFSSANDKTIRAWFFEMDGKNVNNGNPCIKVFEGHTKGVHSMVFIPGADIWHDQSSKKINPSDMLVSGSADYTAKSWSFETGKNIKTFSGHCGAITCMVTDPTGKLLFTGSYDTTIRSWHISRGDCLRVMEGHDGAILNLLIVNRLMFSSSSDGTARSWVTEFGDCTTTFTGHKHSVAVIKFHKGILFTGSGDSTVKAFDAKKGFLLGELKGHTAAVNTLAVVKNKLYSGSSDNTLQVWDINHWLNSSNVNESGKEQRMKLEQQQNQNLKQLDKELDEYYPEV